ncbi:MAG TPA: gephyrin-like molybdotransferase Glp [Terriglobales bacterium]|nr:gephyrin-like molybdotransferase Glp [Terriglobales bacterium]
MSSKAQSRSEKVLDFHDARKVVLEHAESVRCLQRDVEKVPILDSAGRTLAEDILADRDFPPFPRATRDGYAVRNLDVRNLPAELKLVGEVRAGGGMPAGFTGLHANQAIAIMTGAPVPNGADAVVMIEYTERHGDRVRTLKPVSAGENIVPRGSEARAGSVLIERGKVVSHPQIALAASVGKCNLAVYARPRVSILSTGDEVVPIDHVPGDHQIRNSNSFSLAAQVAAAGGEPVQLAIAPDERTRLRELIAQGLNSDLLLLSGGVSAGEYDLVEDVLSEFAVEFLFTGVQIQPGKPLVFGRARESHSSSSKSTYFFGLPGNPISTMVTFQLFASVMVGALSGVRCLPLRATKVQLAADVHVKAGLTRFLPAKLSGAWNDAAVELIKWQGSGDIAAFSRADCLLVIPADRENFAPGEWMTVLPL